MDGIEPINSSIHLLCDSSYFWFKIKFEEFMNSKSTNSKFNPIVNGLKVDAGFFSVILKVIESSSGQLYLLLIQIFLILKKLASSRRVLRQYLSFFAPCTLGATIQLSLVFFCRIFACAICHIINFGCVYSIIEHFS